MNGWLLVRIAGIVVGIATLLRVLTNEKLANYDPLFQAWMDRVSDIVELGFLTDLIRPFLNWGIDQVRNLGISVPDLEDQWRPVFVLLFFLFAVVARHSRSVAAIPWAFLLALSTATAAGISGNVFTTTGMGVALYFSLHPDNLMGSRLAPVGMSAIAGFSGFFLNGFELVGANPIVALAAFILTFGVVSVSYGLTFAVPTAERTVTNLLTNRPIAIGIDILSVMLVALFFVSLFANPPIW